MKKLIIFLIFTISMMTYASNSAPTYNLGQKINFKNYTLTPLKVKKISNHEFDFIFKINYKDGAYGFHHDIKLLINNNYLSSTVESIVSGFATNNQNAIIKLYVPQGYRKFTYNGIGIVDRDLMKVLARIPIE